MKLCWEGGSTMASDQKPEVVWHPHSVPRQQREQLKGHRGCLVWFTGLSGSGKSTLANAVDTRLNGLGVHTYVLDGDNIRQGLCATPEILGRSHASEHADRFGLTFDPMDREENIRRVGAAAQLLVDAGILTLSAFVSPYRKDRQLVREWIEAQGATGDFIEVYVDAPLAVCEQRDPKELYKKARAGEISNFTGISAPYEAPADPEIHVHTDKESPDQLADYIVRQLVERGVVPAA